MDTAALPVPSRVRVDVIAGEWVSLVICECFFGAKIMGFGENEVNGGRVCDKGFPRGGEALVLGSGGK